MNRQEKLIAEIHAEFDTAQDRLLSQANAVLSSKNEPIVSVSNRLRAIGFTNTPTAKRGSVVNEQLVKSATEAKIIQHYSFNYPFLKFLTESELNRICTKYDLVYAPSDSYTEEVPEKNIKDIESAQILNREDMVSISQEVIITEFYRDGKELEKWLNGRPIPYPNDAYVHYSGYPSESEVRRRIVEMGYTGEFGNYTYRSAMVRRIDKSGIFIAAPQSHFNTDGLKKKGLGLFRVFETKITDPIVFRYVRGGIQVLTKWGLEANDPDLVVPKLN